ncbi:transcription intermediary factor 1-alpha-like [Patiria miniata]|uniref:Uncharacterized protein n=1 Tax=Patiria miniata TaxID=46514 RepID=A0A913Z1E9_PATMI|nr:transcription intermediary factor 1-alpha-like [Patiria miniata]
MCSHEKSHEPFKDYEFCNIIYFQAYANISPVDDETNAAMTAATVLRDIALNHLTCNLCNQRYRAPKTLSCLHSFCTTCLRSRLDKCPGPWRREIICPICEEVTELSQVNELTGVRDSTQVQALLEDVEKLEECLTGHKMKASVDEVTTIQQVTTDYQKLRVYDRDPSSDNGDGRSGRTTPQEAAVCDAKTCSKHPRKDLKLFCKTCQVMICKDCTLSNHHASSHSYVDATSAVTVCRRHLDTMLPMIQQDCKEFTQAASSARNAYCRLHMNIQASKNKILQVEEREVARVRAHGEQLRKEAIELGKQNAREIEAIYKSHCDQAQRASHIEGRIKHALTKATSLEILKMKQDLFEHITTVKKVITQSHNLSFLDFKGHLPNPTADINLGTLLTKEKWKKIIDFGRQPGKGFRQVGFVAVYSNGDVAATDMESWTLTVVKCGHHISHMKRLNELSKKALIRPYAIAINTHDELVVLDNSRVKVLDRQMGFLLQVPTSFPEYPVRNSFGSILSCLAVDRQNRIAVGHRGKEIISLHRQDGSLIQVVPAPMIDTQLTISQQQRLVYSNYEARKVLSRDFNGQLVFCVDTDDKLPTGVCCDKAGYIYVAMHTDSAGRCEIHQFDPDGVAIGCVVRGLDNPLGLTFTKDDELVVADKYSVKIYRRA